ncbi:MAG: hypothetical protein IKA88_03395, partial [Clostridia bacterium]|nr:hypothetical protein [Clostridia bacterium]
SADFALEDLGVTGTLVSATPAVVENGVLKATGLVMGDNVYTVVTETEDAIYTYTITIVRAELPHEQLAQQYTNQAALEVAVASLNLEGTLVSVKTAAGVDVVVADGIIELVDLVSGDNTFVITTDAKAYDLIVFKYDTTISTMDEFAAYMSNKTGKYAILTTDLDATNWENSGWAASMPSFNINHSERENALVIGNSTEAGGWEAWSSGVLDGCGHTVSNFFAWGIYGKSTTDVTIRNIGMKFEQWIQSSQYTDGVFGRETARVTLENAWLDITVSTDAIVTAGANPWGVFGWHVSGCTLKNVVVNLNVIGSQTATIKAGNGAGGGTVNNLENVYVVCNNTALITADETNGWNNVQIVSKASEITTIGGNFEVKADGLYYSNVKVLAEPTV